MPKMLTFPHAVISGSTVLHSRKVVPQLLCSFCILSSLLDVAISDHDMFILFHYIIVGWVQVLIGFELDYYCVYTYYCVHTTSSQLGFLVLILLFFDWLFNTTVISRQLSSVARTPSLQCWIYDIIITVSTMACINHCMCMYVHYAYQVPSAQRGASPLYFLEFHFPTHAKLRQNDFVV